MTRSIFIAQLLVASLQVIAGLIAIGWAAPIFADPPFLANGLVREYSTLSAMLADNDLASEPLSDLRSKLNWLFHSLHDGVLVVLIAGAALVISGLAQAGLSASSWLKIGSRRGSAA